MHVPFTLISLVTWSPRGHTLRMERILFPVCLLYGGSFSLPVPPTCHPRFWHRGATDRMFASLTQILHIQGVVQQSDLGLLHRCPPPARMNVCIWSDLSLTLSPCDPPPPPSPSPHTPSPFHSRWRHWQRGRERALIPKPVGLSAYSN